MNKFGLPQQTTDEIINYFNSKPEIKKVMIFGSRAKGNYHNGSDIDFAVWMENIPVSHLAWDLDELPTPYKFDVIDFNTLTHEGMKNSIQKDGKLFYSRNESV